VIRCWPAHHLGAGWWLIEIGADPLTVAAVSPTGMKRGVRGFTPWGCENPAAGVPGCDGRRRVALRE